MYPIPNSSPLPDEPSTPLRRASRWQRGAFLVALAALPAIAQASLFQGETLDAVANVMAWVVLVIAPTVVLAVFWMVHILPEKVAENRQHPQAKAIQCLCLLSLAFGGLLWPLAWLWAYSKPVLYKMAYGTDKLAHDETEGGHAEKSDGGAGELEQLRQRVAELEGRLSDQAIAGMEKA
ncbi:MAG: DUF3302 domain-containing protein [Lysobacterales bacterium]